MATQAEVAFVQHLGVPSSLAEIVRSEFPADYLPTTALRPVVEWAVAYWHGRSADGVSPSPEAFGTHFANVLAEHRIDMTIDPEDTLEWARDVLDGEYVGRAWAEAIRPAAVEMAAADTLAKPLVLSRTIDTLMEMQSRLDRPSERGTAEVGITHAVQRYEDRQSGRSTTDDSVLFGMEDFDNHVGGIRPGEMCVVGGMPKAGKSYMLLIAALNFWRRGGVPVLFTLEFGVDQLMDRLVMMAAGVDSHNWERGTITHAERARIEAVIDEMSGGHPFHVLQPGPGQRSMQHLIRKGKALGDALFIDQLTFVEPSRHTASEPRWRQVGESLHEGKAMISSGKRVPLVLAHQVNRDGQKAAEKANRLDMWHMAEASEVERTADMCFGLWTTPTMRLTNRAYLQSLASRRTDLVNWAMLWRPWIGQYHITGRVHLGDE